MNGTATIPETMTAIAITEPGGPEVLKPVILPVPVPGPGELLVRVRAAGVNRPDVMQRQGKYPPPPGAPETPGLEIAGEVVAVGPDGVEMVIGQRVCALVAGGGYADYALAHAAHCLPLPDALSFTEAAAIPETLFTVWSNLFERAFVADGDTVLVHGGTSGIGTMAIALCGLFDIRIFVTCGSDEKCEAARALGAMPINYRTQDFVEVIKAETGGKGVNAVLDMVGGDYVPRNLKCLGDDGRHVSIAVMSGPKATVFLPEIMQRRLTLTGSTLRPRSPAFKAMLTAEIERSVWPMVEAGELRPVIDKVFPLADVAAAHARMDAGEHVGKIVLEMA
jgi:putative PIG3 family NAD(P)H quinone oxidoreductase